MCLTPLVVEIPFTNLLAKEKNIGNLQVLLSEMIKHTHKKKNSALRSRIGPPKQLEHITTTASIVPEEQCCSVTEMKKNRDTVFIDFGLCLIFRTPNGGISFERMALMPAACRALKLFCNLVVVEILTLTLLLHFMWG